MTQSELNEVVNLHGKWLRGEKGGTRAVLRGADLTGADLTRAVLRGADLTGADLTRADLRGAVLRGAVLRGADLTDAVLRGADLTGADLTRAVLTRAVLRGAVLRGAVLTGAVLRGAVLTGARLPHFQICPQEGSFVAWKKLQNGVVAKLEIPAEAKRTSSLVGRKCRCEFVRVLSLSSGESAFGIHDASVKYTVGEITRADKFDDDIRVECTNGIHFFITREEAEEYS